MDFDVAIIGGGPAGSTAATLLKKYDPTMRVGVWEREVFPRDHVGESHLPTISLVLEEMGCWDKVEAANFPIKIGATYRWGRSSELWDFDFFPARQFKDEPRPAKYVGQRRRTAFQVDRAIYDKILLDHASETGCEVYQGAKVVEVRAEEDAVQSLLLQDGREIKARHFIDASGHSGILRRAMGVKSEYPSSLQNIAIWDYWQNADWAVEIGVGGTRIQILSLGYGWIWFIPLGPTRTSVGLVVPAEYYKKSGMRPDALYAQALKDESRIAGLMKNAKSEGKLATTNDWSFLAERFYGENWFLVGESGGFADPILSAGMSMAHYAGLEVANTIVELNRGEVDPQWLRSEFGRRQLQRITSHLRFADYWYTANEQFVDLQAFTSKIAEERGLNLTPEQSWAWLAAGGFIDEDFQVGIAGFSITTIKQMGEFLSDLKAESPVSLNNIFKLDLEGAVLRESASYGKGRVQKTRCYVRGDRLVPLQGVFAFLIPILQRASKLPEILQIVNQEAQKYANDRAFMLSVMPWLTQGLEALVTDGWVKASYDPNLPRVPIQPEAVHLQWNQDSTPESR